LDDIRLINSGFLNHFLQFKNYFWFLKTILSPQPNLENKVQVSYVPTVLVIKAFQVHLWAFLCYFHRSGSIMSAIPTPHTWFPLESPLLAIYDQRE